jgi:hypothetical protein
MRIKNGEDYLKATILSIINQVDEIICVFNDCNDNTENILIKLEQMHPKLIKVYKYIPPAYVMNSEKYLDTLENSVNSFSYYSNFALSKTTKKYCVKVDDDELFFSNSLINVRNIIQKNNDIISIGLRGINLFDFKNELYINLNDEFTCGSDTILFKYNEKCRFYKTQNLERFNCPFKIDKIITVFYHTKRCKKDRGINNYLLNDNKKSRYNKITIDYFNNLKLIDLNKYLNGKTYEHPSNLNFKYINNSKKIYDSNVLNTFENNINNKINKDVNNINNKINKDVNKNNQNNILFLLKQKKL